MFVQSVFLCVRFYLYCINIKCRQAQRWLIRIVFDILFSSQKQAISAYCPRTDKIGIVFMLVNKNVLSEMRCI